MSRPDGRRNDEMRPVHITPGYLAHAEGSALIELGRTRVLCAVSIEDRLPPFLRGSGGGWITAEYGMLPRSTKQRTPREAAVGRLGGRTHEIQRMIGRSLRAVANLESLKERTFTIDCDVIEADGGTRTAAITAAYVALRQALEPLVEKEEIPPMPLGAGVAATSVGIVEGVAVLDLCYDEDSQAEVDFNVVMTDDGRFIEVQGTAESRPFPRESMDELLALAEQGLRSLFDAQNQALAELEGD